MADVAFKMEALDSALNKVPESGRGLDDGVPGRDVERDSQQMRELLNDGGRTEPVRALQETREDGAPLQSLGDAILRHMEGISRDFRDQKKKIITSIDEQTGVGQQGYGPVDHAKSVFHLMSLQMQVAETSLEIDLIAKGISKFDSTVDQLSKLQ